jgi:hypothetical protein
MNSGCHHPSNKPPWDPGHWARERLALLNWGTRKPQCQRTDLVSRSIWTDHQNYTAVVRIIKQHWQATIMEAIKGHTIKIVILKLDWNENPASNYDEGWVLKCGEWSGEEKKQRWVPCFTLPHVAFMALVSFVKLINQERMTWHMVLHHRGYYSSVRTILYIRNSQRGESEKKSLKQRL